MREIVFGPDALLTAVALTTILTVPSVLTNASLTVTFILATNYYKMKLLRPKYGPLVKTKAIQFVEP